MDKETFDSVEIGEKVDSWDGFGGRRRSTVMAKVEDRWGRHLKAKFDNPEDGEWTTVHGFTKVGIGHYRVKDKETI